MKASVINNLNKSKELDTIVRLPIQCASTGKDIDICYNDFGNKSDPCLLLVQGVGTSLLGYDVDNFIQHFLDQHFRVIRFDNRDVGKSTNFNEYNDGNMVSLLRLGLPEWASLGEKLVYTMDDLVSDCYGLLLALGVLDKEGGEQKKVHLFGVSMGGMIVQQYCIRYPTTVASMTLHMTHAGIGDCYEPPLLNYLVFLKPSKGNSAEDMAEYMVNLIDTLSQGYRYEKDNKGNVIKDSAHNRAVREEMAQYFIKAYERNQGQEKNGLPRQCAAVMRAPRRLQKLKEICGKYQIPVVVLHGGRDPLIPVANGYQLANAIPHARLMVYPEMGHDFPEDLSQSFAEQTILNMRAGELKRNRGEK